MNQRKIAMGPGAASIILIIVSLSLCMLAMLTLISSRNDLSLATRSADMIQQVYELNAKSEESLYRLDEILLRLQKENPDQEAYLKAVEKNLPEGMEIDGDVVSWSEPMENRNLECAVQLRPPGEKTRTKWISHKLIVESSEDDW